MTVFFNCTGTRRKELVKAISEILVHPSRYLGAPSFGYRIDFYTVNKEGNLLFDDATDPNCYEELLGGLGKQGFHYEDMRSEEVPVVRYDVEPHETEEKEVLETEQPDCETSDRLTVTMPRSFFTEQSLANLRQIIENKSSLIKHALNTDSLEINENEKAVEFPWFTIDEDGDSDAYIEFISTLCGFAKERKRVNVKPDTSDNEKYAFRCFLIRMGMIGTEYKNTRKVLLRSLSGNSAFRHGRPETGGDDNEISE